MTIERSIYFIKDSENGASCDGGGGALGHPQVFLALDEHLHIDCYYCGQRFARLNRSQKPC
jgi:NADH dehydrogenase (ubiquinone) Fe-S protein 6